MRRAAAALLAAITLAHLGVGSVHAQSSCSVSLDAGVLVAPGEHRQCAIWVIGHDATVARDGVVGGGVTVVYGHAAIDGEVTGSVNVLGGDAAITGRVRGDVYASGTVRLGASASIRGNVTGGDVAAADGASVAGTTIELQRGWTGMPRTGRQWLTVTARLAMRSFVTLILAGLFGVLAAVSFPGLVGLLRGVASRGAPSVIGASLLGLGCLIATGAVAWIFWRQWGSQLILLLPATLALIGALGVGSRLGGRLLPRRGPVLQAGTGMAILTLVVTFAPQLGHWAFFCTGAALFGFVGAWSIGIALLALFGRPGTAGAGTEGLAATADRGHVEPSPPAASHRPPVLPLGQPQAADVRQAEPPPGAAEPLPEPAEPPLEAAEAVEAAEAAEAPAERIGSGAPPEPVAWPTASIEPPPEVVDRSAELEDRSTALDVRRIPGISPIYAHLLATAGIPSLVELAEHDPADLVTKLAVPGVLPIDLETAELWVAMARRRVGR